MLHADYSLKQLQSKLNATHTHNTYGYPTLSYMGEGGHLCSCCVVEYAPHVVLKGHRHSNGTGYGPMSADLCHHVLLPLHLPVR